MSRANLSILGLYNWDSTIFDLMEVPTGMVKADVINSILLRCAELEILYPDTDFLKQAIGIWSKNNQYAWEKLYKTTMLEYNPIWNKDGKITEIETIKNEKEGEGFSKDIASGSSNSDQSSTTSVAGFNSSDLVERESTEASGTTKASNVATNNFGNKNNENIARANTRIEQGNIGITTTQSMIEEERAVAQFSMNDFIAMDFKNRFCLMVY